MKVQAKSSVGIALIGSSLVLVTACSSDSDPSRTTSSGGGTNTVTGGSAATGGTDVTTGGSLSDGGSNATGGTSVAGGDTNATGGTSDSGGSFATGGNTSATGGSVATGGDTSATGGSPGTGGSTATSAIAIDLSTFLPISAGTYDGTAMTLTVVNQTYVQFPLSQALSTGQTLTVHVTGVNNGTAGLRSWLVNTTQATSSNAVTTYVGAGLPSGSFTLDYVLTATGSAGYLFIKGPAYGTNIDSIVISSVTVTY